THEDFTLRLLTRPWIPKLLRKTLSVCVGYLEALTARRCEASIATQPEVAMRLGLNAHIISNAPRIDRAIMSKVQGEASTIGDKGCDFRLVYIGGVGPTRGLYEMVEALPLINKTMDCRLWLIG